MKILDYLGTIFRVISKGATAAFSFASLFLVAALIMAPPVMWLWDFVMPDLLGVSEITFLQALALNLLTAILFKNTNK